MHSCFPQFLYSQAMEVSQSHREEETGTVLKWVIHKTQCMTSNTPERWIFVVTVFPHIIQVIVTIVINFNERGREKEKEGEREKGRGREREKDMGWTCDSVTVDSWGIQRETVVVSVWNRQHGEGLWHWSRLTTGIFFLCLCTVNAADETVLA